MTDIILFQPKCGIMDIMGVRTPTGLLSIAAVPVQKGYRIVLIDQRINQNWLKEIKSSIASGAKIFCLTTMVGEQINYVMEVSKLVKGLKSDILIVLGGSWSQIQPEMCMQDKNIDIVCCGEGDYLLSDIMDYCEGKKAIEDVFGIMFRDKEGNIKKTSLRPLIENLDELPKIPYHLVNLRNYSAVGFRPGKPSMALVLSRGCPYRCTFCSIVTLFGRRWRSYSIKRILEELDILEHTYGINDFYFNDDNITGNRKFFIDLVDALAESGRDYNWGTAGIRADAIMSFDDRTFINLVKSGCKNLDVGVETGNPRLLKLIKKDTSLELIREVNKRLSKYPILVKYSLMGGFPTETEEEFLDTLKFRKILQEENENATAPIFFYTPFPRTEMFQLAIGNGFKPPETLSDWADFNYHTWYNKYPSWLTKRKIRLVENAVFLSYFSNKKLGYKYTNTLMKIMFKMYYPLAKWRYNNNNYDFMIEKHAANFIAKVGDKINLFGRFQKKG